MKKQAFGFVAVVAALVLAGCSSYGTVGNPTELTGTWTSTKTSYTVDSGTVAGTSEGTWEYTSTQEPTPTYISTNDTTGVKTTTYYDNETIVTTNKTVISADGSYTNTVTTAYTKAKRDAIAAVTTGTSQNNAWVAIPESAKTETVTKTVVVTINSDNTYNEVVTKTDAWTAGTGDYSSQLKSSTTTVKTNPRLSNPTFSSLAWGKHTVAPAIYGTSTDEKTVASVSLVITSDGAYTYTTTTTKTATSPVAGTASIVAVESGTINGSSTDSGKQLTFNKTSVKTTSSGTGYYTWTYPSTEVSFTDSSTSSTTYNYYLTSSKYLVINGNSTWATLTKN
jgi:hypothetical protein